MSIPTYSSQPFWKNSLSCSLLLAMLTALYTGAAVAHVIVDGIGNVGRYNSFLMASYICGSLGWQTKGK